MHKLHGTAITNQKHILRLAYFFTVYIQREHDMEQALSLAKRMEFEVMITCRGITRIIVSRRGLSTSEISIPLRYRPNYSICCVNV